MPGQFGPDPGAQGLRLVEYRRPYSIGGAKRIAPGLFSHGNRLDMAGHPFIFQVPPMAGFFLDNSELSRVRVDYR